MQQLKRLAVAIALTTLAAQISSARVATETRYTKQQTFSAALRYLRVDQGFEIVEKDPEAAYLLFKYRPAGGNDNASSGAVEVVQLQDGVRLIVQLPKMPEYHERVMRDALLRKLRDEYGAPPPRKAEPPKQDENEDKAKDGKGDSGESGSAGDSDKDKD